jgi:hypothetical protein|tara:strand:+ start:359 stop:802 length:444 start_codon:yes stop_codon:yes gene_type:complete
MISHHVFEWDLSNKINHEDDINIVQGLIFHKAIECAYHTFDLKVTETMNSIDHTNLHTFREETDWLRYLQDRTYNFVYAYDIKNLNLVIIDQHKSIGIQMKNKYLFCMPYWMTYKFISTEKNYSQQIISIGILTKDRPKLKKTKKLW